MEKSEVAAQLKKAGYQVQVESSVVIVVFYDKINLKQEIKKLKSFFSQIGYSASFGIRQSKGKKNESEEVPET